MQVKAKRVGFLGGALKQPGDVFEVDKPASWYEAVEEVKPAKAGKAAKDSKADPVNPVDLT